MGILIVVLFSLLHLAVVVFVIAFVVRRIRRWKRVPAGTRAEAPAHPAAAAPDFSLLPKAAAIISRGNRQIVSEMIEGAVKEEASWSRLVHWLIDNRYAAAIDWNAEEVDILCNLDAVVEKLGFPFRMESFVLAEDADENTVCRAAGSTDATRELLCALSSWLRRTGYAIGSINLEDDSHVLFIIEADSDNEALLAAAAEQFGYRVTFNFE